MIANEIIKIIGSYFLRELTSQKQSSKHGQRTLASTLHPVARVSKVSWK